MQNINKIKNLTFWGGLFFLSLLAGYQIYQTTTWGAGLSPDSVSYLRGARDILENGNLNGLGSDWPPLYYILIAFSGLLSHDTISALRWLQIVTLVANLICFSYVIWKASNRALIPSLIGGLLFVTAPSVLYIHTMAWSEGSFCFFALLGVFFLARYLEHENSFTLLTFSSLFIGLAFFTRYVGVTLVITGIIALLFFAANNRTKRISTSLFFFFFSTSPMLIWKGKDWFIINTETIDKSFVISPIPIEQIQQGIQVLLNWLHIPAEYPFLLSIVLAGIAIQYIVTVKQTAAANLNRTLDISFLFICIYVPFLLLSCWLFDAHIPLDNRLLIPIYIFLNLGILLLIQRSSHIRVGRGLGYLEFLLLIWLIFAQYNMQQKFIKHAGENGLDFASKEWVQSDTLQWLKNLPKGVIIYTNGPEPIEIYANCFSKMIPRHTHTDSLQKNDNISRDINIMITELSNTNGVIVYFKNITWRWYLPTISQLREVLPLQLVYEGNDSIIVKLAEKK